MTFKTEVNPQYKALTLLSMLYLSIILSANILVFKLTLLGTHTISAGAFLIPTWFILGDIIAEVYGYQESKKLIWFSLFCIFIFSIICVFFIVLPSPAGWNHQAEYNYVLSHQLNIFMGLALAMIGGSFLNAYLVAKWKILIRGKYFWLRSLGSSLTAQIIFTIVTLSVDLHNTLPHKALLELMLFSFPFKMVYLAVGTIPATFIVLILKKIEGIDIYDHNLKFNPFG